MTDYEQNLKNARLFVAIINKDLAAVKNELAAGADPNAQVNRVTPVSMALKSLNIEILKTVITDKRTDPNLRDEDGEPSLSRLSSSLIKTKDPIYSRPF